MRPSQSRASSGGTQQRNCSTSIDAGRAVKALCGHVCTALRQSLLLPGHADTEFCRTQMLIPSCSREELLAPPSPGLQSLNRQYASRKLGSDMTDRQMFLCRRWVSTPVCMFRFSRTSEAEPIARSLDKQDEVLNSSLRTPAGKIVPSDANTGAELACVMRTLASWVKKVN